MSDFVTRHLRNGTERQLKAHWGDQLEGVRALTEAWGAATVLLILADSLEMRIADCTDDGEALMFKRNLDAVLDAITKIEGD